MNPRLPPKWFPIGGDIMEMMRPRRQYSAEEKEAFWAYYEAVSPAPWRFMQLSWAQEAKRRNDDSLVIFRPYSKTENQDPFDVDTFFERNIRATDGGIILNLFNEPYLNYNPNKPDALKRFAATFAKLMDKFGKEGRAIVGPNIGVGMPQEGYYDHLEEMWDAFRRWKHLHYVSYHPYFSYLGLLPGDGRIMRWQPILKAINDPDVLMVFTEGGCDDQLDGSGKRGFRDSFTEDEYADLLFTLHKTHHNHPQIVGTCLYCYGNTGEPTEPPGQGEDWITYDWSHAYQVKKRILIFSKEWREMSQPAPTPIPAVPKPGHVIIESTKEGMHVRKDAGVNFPVIVTLQKGQQFTVLPITPRHVGDYDWFQVQGVALVPDKDNPMVTKYLGFVGWSAATHATKIKPDVEPLPCPEPPPIPALSLDEMDIDTTLTALMDKFKVLDTLQVDDWTDWQRHIRALKNLIYKRPTIRQLNVLTAPPVAAAVGTTSQDDK